MSRTYRNFGYAYAEHGHHWHAAKERHSAGIHPGDWWSHLLPGYDFRKAHVVHGRDGAIQGEICGAFSAGPNCYNTWDEVWSPNGKRHAKRLTGRFRRLRGLKLIHDELRALESEGAESGDSDPFRSWEANRADQSL